MGKVFKDLVPGDIVYYVKTYHPEESKGPELIEATILKLEDSGIFSFDLGESNGGWYFILDRADIEKNIARATGFVLITDLELPLIYTDRKLAKEEYMKECKNFLRSNYKHIRHHETELMELRDLQLKYTKIVDDYEDLI